MPPTPNTHGGRLLALLALQRWSKQLISAEEAIQDVAASADPRERALCNELVMGVLRWRSALDASLRPLLKQPIERLHPTLLEILRLAIYQLAHSRAPERAIVHSSVELCRQASVNWGTSLVNGVLRSYLRRPSELPQPPATLPLERLADRLAHPLWMLELLAPVLGDELPLWLESNNQVPPLTLSVNPTRSTREQLLARLADAGIEALPTPYSSLGITLPERGAVQLLPGFSDGLFVVQDEGSQLVTLCCDARPGQRVLDACSAPGGKTVQLASAVGSSGQVVATDSVQARLKGLHETLQRTVPGPVSVQHLDWEQPTPAERVRVGENFDVALVDAPCSGLGVLRRIPEIKWRRKPEELARNAVRQLEILTQVAAHVRPGGALVYSVCSPAQEEGPEVIDAFLKQQRSWTAVNLREVLPTPLHDLIASDGTLRTWPHRHGCDAFFVARLTRR